MTDELALIGYLRGIERAEDVGPDVLVRPETVRAERVAPDIRVDDQAGGFTPIDLGVPPLGNLRVIEIGDEVHGGVAGADGIPRFTPVAIRTPFISTV
jgi:hypothetical protein